MHGRKLDSNPTVPYKRLVKEDQYGCIKDRVQKGYIPVLVGSDYERAERCLVPVKLFKDPRISALLDMAAQEFGYEQEGILRLPCDAKYFQSVFDVISKSR